MGDAPPEKGEKRKLSKEKSMTGVRKLPWTGKESINGMGGGYQRCGETADSIYKHRG